MPDRFEGLSTQERAACVVAERVLGAVAEPWDVHGRQGAVDAMLTLDDGRRAAFEVTALAEGSALQTESLLGRDGFAWPSPGQWTWTIEVGSPADLPYLRHCYARAALLCEAAGATRPHHLRRSAVDDPDVAWLLEESSSDMFGHPDVPALIGSTVRNVMVVPAGRGGAVDSELAGLKTALADVFTQPSMSRHLNKLAAASADERHLFLPVHHSALPFPVADGLHTGDTVPPDPPPLPAAITHLWLAPQFGRRVLLWGPAGWQNQYPYNA